MIKIIILGILFVFFLLLFVPWSITFNVNIICNRFFLDIKEINGFKNNIVVKVCGLMPVYFKKLFNSKKVKKKTKNSRFKKVISSKKTILKLLSKAYFEKTCLSLGFNVDDTVNNSYINACLNTIICILINSNQKNFNLKNVYYSTYVDDNLVKLNFNCIIKISLENTIKVIVKEYIKMLKNEKKNSLTFKERSIYGRASN